MTTNIAAAASGSIQGLSLRALLISSGLLLAGCESGSNILGGPTAATPETQVSQQVPQQPVQAKTRVAIAPVIGAPDGVAKQLQNDLVAAVEKQNVAVASGVDKIDYTLRGYVVAAKEKSQTKVSYIWDVTDASGKRVNRITGEEVVAGAPGKDPWASVSADVAKQIAQKSAASFVAWLPQNGAKPVAVAGSTAPVGVGAAPSPQSAVAGGPTPVENASLRSQGPATGSISRNDLTAIVPAVSGAPGDGAQSLTGAIQAELAKNGVPLTNQTSASSYRVEGVVKVGTARDGKQPIQIDWNVKDPSGKKLGTVSQKNEIPEGSLDGSWGKTADAAAAAAAQGILKLLPQKTASN